MFFRLHMYWYHTVFAFLYPTYCTSAMPYKFMSMCIYVYHFLYILGQFHILVIVNNAAMNIGVHVSFWNSVFFQYIPRSEIAEISHLYEWTCGHMQATTCIKAIHTMSTFSVDIQWFPHWCLELHGQGWCIKASVTLWKLVCLPKSSSLAE